VVLATCCKQCLVGFVVAKLGVLVCVGSIFVLGVEGVGTMGGYGGRCWCCVCMIVVVSLCCVGSVGGWWGWCKEEFGLGWVF